MDNDPADYSDSQPLENREIGLVESVQDQQKVVCAGDGPTHNMHDRTTTVFVFDGQEVPDSSQFSYSQSRQRAREHITQQALGVPTTDIKRSQYGRPYLEGNKATEFNLSHYETLVVLAKSPTRVGVDLVGAVHDQTQLVDDMWDQVLSKREIQQFAQDSTIGDKEWYFMQMWCVKEAYLKYMGTGLGQAGLDLRDIEVNVAARTVGDARWEYASIQTAGYGSVNRAGSRRVVCVIVQKQVLPIEVINIHYMGS